MSKSNAKRNAATAAAPAIVAALTTSTAPAPTVASNDPPAIIVNSFEDVLAAARDAGAVTGEAADSLLKLSEVVFYAGVAGVMTAAQVKETYVAFAKANNENCSFGRRINLEKGDSVRVSASKLARFYELGVIPGVDRATKEGVLSRAKSFLTNPENKAYDKGGSRYEKMVSLVRLALGDEKANRPQNLNVGDADFRKALTPAPKDDPIGDVFREMAAIAKRAIDKHGTSRATVRWQRLQTSILAEFQAYKGDELKAVANTPELQAAE